MAIHCAEKNNYIILHLLDFSSIRHEKMIFSRFILYSINIIFLISYPTNVKDVNYLFRVLSNRYSYKI